MRMSPGSHVAVYIRETVGRLGLRPSLRCLLAVTQA